MYRRGDYSSFLYKASYDYFVDNITLSLKGFNDSRDKIIKQLL